MPYRIVIDRGLCISCGAAPTTCPQVYELGKDNGKNKVVEKYSVELGEGRSVGIIPDELYTCAKEGADVCPVSAIYVEKIE